MGGIEAGACGAYGAYGAALLSTYVVRFMNLGTKFRRRTSDVRRTRKGYYVPLQGVFSFDSFAQRTRHKKKPFFVWVLMNDELIDLPGFTTCAWRFR